MIADNSFCSHIYRRRIAVHVGNIRPPLQTCHECGVSLIASKVLDAGHQLKLIPQLLDISKFTQDDCDLGRLKDVILLFMLADQWHRIADDNISNLLVLENPYKQVACLVIKFLSSLRSSFGRVPDARVAGAVLAVFTCSSFSPQITLAASLLEDGDLLSGLADHVFSGVDAFPLLCYHAFCSSQGLAKDRFVRLMFRFFKCRRELANLYNFDILCGQSHDENISDAFICLAVLCPIVEASVGHLCSSLASSTINGEDVHRLLNACLEYMSNVFMSIDWSSAAMNRELDILRQAAVRTLSLFEHRGAEMIRSCLGSSSNSSGDEFHRDGLSKASGHIFGLFSLCHVMTISQMIEGHVKGVWKLVELYIKNYDLVDRLLETLAGNIVNGRVNRKFESNAECLHGITVFESVSFLRYRRVLLRFILRPECGGCSSEPLWCAVALRILCLDSSAAMHMFHYAKLTPSVLRLILVIITTQEPAPCVSLVFCDILESLLSTTSRYDTEVLSALYCSVLNQGSQMLSLYRGCRSGLDAQPPVGEPIQQPNYCTCEPFNATVAMLAQQFQLILKIMKKYKQDNSCRSSSRQRGHGVMSVHQSLPHLLVHYGALLNRLLSLATAACDGETVVAGFGPQKASGLSVLETYLQLWSVLDIEYLGAIISEEDSLLHDFSSICAHMIINQFYGPTCHPMGGPDSLIFHLLGFLNMVLYEWSQNPQCGRFSRHILLDGASSRSLHRALCVYLLSHEKPHLLAAYALLVRRLLFWQDDEPSSEDNVLGHISQAVCQMQDCIKHEELTTGVGPDCSTSKCKALFASLSCAVREHSSRLRTEQHVDQKTTVTITLLVYALFCLDAGWTSFMLSPSPRETSADTASLASLIDIRLIPYDAIGVMAGLLPLLGSETASNPSQVIRVKAKLCSCYLTETFRSAGRSGIRRKESLLVKGNHILPSAVIVCLQSRSWHRFATETRGMSLKPDELAEAVCNAANMMEIEGVSSMNCCSLLGNSIDALKTAASLLTSQLVFDSSKLSECSGSIVLLLEMSLLLLGRLEREDAFCWCDSSRHDVWVQEVCIHGGTLCRTFQYYQLLGDGESSVDMTYLVLRLVWKLLIWPGGLQLGHGDHWHRAFNESLVWGFLQTLHIDREQPRGSCRSARSASTLWHRCYQYVTRSCVEQTMRSWTKNNLSMVTSYDGNSNKLQCRAFSILQKQLYWMTSLSPTYLSNGGNPDVMLSYLVLMWGAWHSSMNGRSARPLKENSNNSKTEMALRNEEDKLSDCNFQFSFESSGAQDNLEGSPLDMEPGYFNFVDLVRQSVLCDMAGLREGCAACGPMPSSGHIDAHVPHGDNSFVSRLKCTLGLLAVLISLLLERSNEAVESGDSVDRVLFDSALLLSSDHRRFLRACLLRCQEIIVIDWLGEHRLANGEHRSASSEDCDDSYSFSLSVQDELSLLMKGSSILLGAALTPMFRSGKPPCGVWSVNMLETLRSSHIWRDSAEELVYSRHNVSDVGQDISSGPAPSHYECNDDCNEICRSNIIHVENILKPPPVSPVLRRRDKGAKDNNREKQHDEFEIITLKFIYRSILEAMVGHSSTTVASP